MHSNKITIQCLLNAGSQNVTNVRNQTPHHIFISNHYDPSITQLLIGKNIDALDDLSRTALHLSAMHNHYLNVATLLEHGANPQL